MGNLLSGAQGAMQKAGGVRGLMENPMFNVGMGLLQANNAGYGQDSNPFRAAMGGLRGAQRNQDMGAERDALKKARDNQDKLQELLQQLYGGQAQGAQVPQMSPGLPPPNPFQTPGINPNAPPTGGVPQGPFGQAPTSAFAPVGAGMPNSQEIGRLMLQYGSPSQQQAVFTQMSAGERFRERLATEDARYNARPGLQDPVHSTQILQDGRIMQTHRSGKTSFSKVDGKEVYAKNPLKVVEDSAGTHVVDTRSGFMDTLTTPEQLGTGAGVQKLTASQVEMRNNIPATITKVQDTLRLVDELESHPGFSGAVGASLSPNWAGSARRGFHIREDQLKGGSFLEGVKELSGLGALSDAEGKKAGDAVARMDSAASESEYLTALEDYRMVLRRGVRNAYEKAGLPLSDIPEEFIEKVQGPTQQVPRHLQQYINPGSAQ